MQCATTPLFSYCVSERSGYFCVCVCVCFSKSPLQSRGQKIVLSVSLDLVTSRCQYWPHSLQQCYLGKSPLFQCVLFFWSSVLKFKHSIFKCEFRKLLSRHPQIVIVKSIAWCNSVPTQYNGNDWKRSSEHKIERQQPIHCQTAIGGHGKEVSSFSLILRHLSQWRPSGF